MGAITNNINPRINDGIAIGPGPFPGPFPFPPFPGPFPPAVHVPPIISVIVPIAGGSANAVQNPNGTATLVLNPAAAIVGFTFTILPLSPGQTGFVTLFNASAFAITGLAIQGAVTGTTPTVLNAGAQVTFGWNGSVFVQVA